MTDLLTPADIERLAHEAGLTMNEVCRRAGVARSIFSRWKIGETTPSHKNYQLLVKVVHAAPRPAPANAATKPAPKRSRAPVKPSPKPKAGTRADSSTLANVA